MSYKGRSADLFARGFPKPNFSYDPFRAIAKEYKGFNITKVKRRPPDPIVCDTNVLSAALYPQFYDHPTPAKDACSKLWENLGQRRRLCVSEPILYELAAILQNTLGLNLHNASKSFREVLSRAYMTHVDGSCNLVNDKDSRVVQTAFAVSARYFVTLDRELYELPQPLRADYRNRNCVVSLIHPEDYMTNLSV
jgi:predicted nucleic acid-binding protein